MCDALRLRGLFLILITRLACCLHIDDSVRHEFANVSFSVNGGQLDLHVWHHHPTVCRRLYDDMNYVTETRAENGSRVLLRGSGGILLQSSSDGIECRLEVRNQEGNAYTIQDVPTLPGTFSAYIVFANGETLHIEKKNATAFVAVVPAHLERTQRRRLQSYFTFECKYPKVRYMKLGVIMDAAFVKKFGGEESAKAEVRKRFKQVSVAYEQQFNIHITPFQILSHDDSECEGCASFAKKCADVGRTLGSLQKFRRGAGKRNAGWHVLSSCRKTGTVGMATISSMGSTRNAAGVSGFMSESELVMVPAHELGHNFGARHTFDHSGRKKGAQDGIMDYTYGKKAGLWSSSAEGGDLFQFHKMHEREMCAVVKRLNDKGASGLVDWEERWTDNPTDTPSDPTDSPSDPTSSPSDPTSSPSDPTDSPSDPTDSPSNPTSTPDPSNSPSDPTSTPDPSDTSSSSAWIVGIVVSALLLCLGLLLLACCCLSRGETDLERPPAARRARQIASSGGRKRESKHRQPKRKARNSNSQSRKSNSKRRKSNSQSRNSRKSTARR